MEELSEKRETATEGRGAAVSDAKQIAWSMTCAPYMNDPEAELAAFSRAVSIKKQMVAVNAQKRSLYEELVARGEDDVCMRDIERDFGFQWSINVGDRRNDDPFFLRSINAEIEASFGCFLTRLDLACASLAGLDADQTSNSAAELLMQARRFAGLRMGKLMTSSVATKEDLLRQAQEIEDKYVKHAVSCQKRVLEDTFAGVNALTCIAASVQDGSNVSSVLQLNYSAARDACVSPPRHLVEALASSGLSLSVLAACFAQIGGAATTGASSLPPSWGRVVDMVVEYFSSSLIAERFSHACVAAINSMRAELALCDASDAWSGIRVAHIRDTCVANVCALPRTDLMCSLQPCQHTSTPIDLFVLATDCTPRALRVVRFVRALTECVRRDVLRPRVVRANLLLASVARFRSEKRFELARILDQTVRPLAQRALVPLREDWFDVESVVASVLAKPSEPRAQSFRSAATTAPFACAAPSRPVATDASGVLLALERDFHIVCAFHRVIPLGGGEVALKSISNLLTSRGAYFEGHSKRSVEQAVSFVVDKCVKKATAAAVFDGEVNYTRAIPGCPDGARVVLDFGGACAIVRFLQNTISKMKESDRTFMTEWHASRSSRNKAKSRAAGRVVKAVNPKHQSGGLRWKTSHT